MFCRHYIASLCLTTLCSIRECFVRITLPIYFHGHLHRMQTFRYSELTSMTSLVNSLCKTFLLRLVIMTSRFQRVDCVQIIYCLLCDTKRQRCNTWSVGWIKKVARNYNFMTYAYVWFDLDLQRSYLGSYKLRSRAPGLTIFHVMLDNVQLVHRPVLYNLFEIFLSPSKLTLCRPLVLNTVVHTSQLVAQTSVAQVVRRPVVCWPVWRTHRQTDA